MLWIIPAWIASVIAIFLLGRYIGNITKRIVVLEEVVKTKVSKQPVVEEPTSTVIDPLDEVQTALYEHDQLMKRLNPDEK